MPLSDIFLRLGLIFTLLLGFNEKSVSQTIGKTLPREQLSTLDSSEFEKNFLVHFNPIEATEYHAQIEKAIEDTIEVDLVVNYLLEAAEKAELNIFDEYWSGDEVKQVTLKGLHDRWINVEQNAFAVLNFGFLGRLKTNQNFYTLLFQCHPTFMEGQYAHIYLANFDRQGKMMGGLKVASATGYVDMQLQQEALIDDQGHISIKTSSIKKGEMFGRAEDYIEESQLTYKMSPDGAIEMDRQRHSGYSGRYLSQDSEEIILIEAFFDEIYVTFQKDAHSFGEQNYQVNEFNQKKREMNVLSSDNQEAFKLSYNADKTLLTYTDAEGSKRVFYRSN